MGHAGDRSARAAAPWPGLRRPVLLGPPQDEAPGLELSRARRLAVTASRNQDLWFAFGLLLLTVALPLFTAAMAGSLDIPRNDDWIFRRIAFELARTGRFELNGFSSMFIIGQILFVQPFLWLSGHQPWAFTAVGVVFATGGVVSAYAVARTLLPSRPAVLAAALLALFPGYLAYATSFMSDVPALAAEFLCLALGAMALRARPVRMGWLLASLVMGLIGFSIREFAVVAPASVLIASFVADRGRARSWGAAICFSAICVALYWWRSSLPGQFPPYRPGSGSFSQPFQAISSLAFVIAPAALVGAIRWRGHLRRIDVLAGLEIGAILTVVRILQSAQEGPSPPVMLGNLASQWGTPGLVYLIGGRPPLFGDAVWAAVNGLALVATVVVLAVGAGVVGAHLRRCDGSLRILMGRFGSPAGILVLFSLTMMGGLVAFGLTRPIFDRYLWPVAPPVAALFLPVPVHQEARARALRIRGADLVLAASATIFTAVLAALSVAYLFNSSAFDAARWRSGSISLRRGCRPIGSTPATNGSATTPRCTEIPLVPGRRPPSTATGGPHSLRAAS